MQYVRASELKYRAIIRNNTNLLYNQLVYIKKKFILKKKYISLNTPNFDVKTDNLVHKLVVNCNFLRTYYISNLKQRYLISSL